MSSWNHLEARNPDPVVSIITPVYNSEQYIGSTYKSLVAQSFKNWEWIVVDDCSTDASNDLLQEFASADDRVHVYRLRVNSGAAASRNFAMSKARGLYLAFLDSDDLWLPEKLSTQLDFMRSDVDFSFTGYEIVDEIGRRTGKVIDGNASAPVTYGDLLMKRVTLGCSTVMLRREIAQVAAMPNLRTGQDYAYWLSILRGGNLAKPLPAVLTQYRLRPGSISRNKLKKALRQWSIYREVEGLPLGRSLVCFGSYAFHALFR